MKKLCVHPAAKQSFQSVWTLGAASRKKQGGIQEETVLQEPKILKGKCVCDVSRKQKLGTENIETQKNIACYGPSNAGDIGSTTGLGTVALKGAAQASKTMNSNLLPEILIVFLQGVGSWGEAQRNFGIWSVRRITVAADAGALESDAAWSAAAPVDTLVECLGGCSNTRSQQKVQNSNQTTTSSCLTGTCWWFDLAGDSKQGS